MTNATKLLLFRVTSRRIAEKSTKLFLVVNTSRGTKPDSGCQTIASRDLISIARYYLEVEKRRKGVRF